MALQLSLGSAAVLRAVEVRGVVQAADGRPIPDVEVRVEGPQTGVLRSVRSDAQGRFRLRVPTERRSAAVRVRITPQAREWSFQPPSLDRMLGDDSAPVQFFALPPR